MGTVRRLLRQNEIDIYNRDCVRYDTAAGLLANVCVLFSSCEERDSSCSSCHTAPVPCSHQMGSTSTPASSTTTSAPAAEGSNVNVLTLKLILNNIQHSSSPVTHHLAVLVTPWRFISPPRASTVTCQTCLETRDTTTPWRR